MSEYRNNYVSADTRQSATDVDWRVVSEQMTSVSASAGNVTGGMQQHEAAPRIVGKDESPLARGQGFAVTAVPFVLVITLLVAGLVILSFSDRAVAFGWFLTGVGGFGLVLLTYVHHQTERNSPGAADRAWAGVEAHKSDNDTEVRLAMVAMEREVRLAAVGVYRQIVNGNDRGTSDGDDAIRRITDGTRQLPRR